MNKSALVIGHADADGHLITEQVRRNLAAIPSLEVTAFVDPQRTKDHKAWTKLDSIEEIEGAELIFFVDLMFAPASFAEEATALVDFVNRRPDKTFFLIDHHPLPTRRLEMAKNLHFSYRPEVVDCAIGPRSGMMVVAALCEGQRDPAITDPVHETLALGMRRAAALGGNLPGEKLLALLQSNCWESIFELGSEDRELHRLPRGRRPATGAVSKSLTKMEQAAGRLLQREAPHRAEAKSGRGKMPYDFDIVNERIEAGSVARVRIKARPEAGRDLEAIVTLLEVAALSLTHEPGATFTRERLIEEARDIGGDEIDLREEDIDIVLKKQSFLKRVGRQLCMR